MSSDPQAIVLLSGGLDSATALAIARNGVTSVAPWRSLGSGTRWNWTPRCGSRVTLGAVEHRR
jgi:predicted PP-loop superfamily ATPase